MGDVIFFILLAAGLAGAITAQGLLLTAREHVRRRWPEWFSQLGMEGSKLRFGGLEERARRRILKPLLTGDLPSGPAEDEVLLRLARLLRLCFGAAAAALIGAALIIAWRAQGGA